DSLVEHLARVRPVGSWSKIVTLFEVTPETAEPANHQLHVLFDQNRFAIEVHINGRGVGPRQIVSIPMNGLAGTADGEPSAAIERDLVFDALLAGGSNDNSILDKLQRIDGH